MGHDDKIITKGQTRDRKKANRRAKEESGSMTAFWKHEEVNKGRLKSKSDKKVAVKVRDNTKKAGRARGKSSFSL